MFVRNRSLISVIVVSMILAVTNSIPFFAGILNQPPGTVYLGTVHYWEDYFFYLNHFFQGAHGAWLTVNRYTPEITQPSIIYWCNVLLGKFFLPPILAYNVSLIILSFIALLLSYKLAIKIFSGNTKLALWAFIYANLATSLINYVKSNEGPMIWWPFQIWRTPHFAFDRLGGAPHQLIQTIFAYLFIYSLACLFDHPQKKYVYYAMLWGILLTSLNPIQSLFYIGVLWFTFLIRKIKTLWILPVTLSVGFAALCMNHALSLPPYIQSKIWESTQHSYTTIPFLMLSIGPVFVLALLGIWKKLTSIELFGLLTIGIGYLLFLSKIPQAVGFSNLRILFPASYIFWGIFAARGTEFLSKKIKPVFIILLFILLSLPTLYWELVQKLPKDVYKTDPLVYIAQPVYEGFEALTKLGTFNDIVLANPTRHMDTLVPALSGHTTYSGHMLTTIDNATKQSEALEFFSGNKSREFLVKNNIKYILFTQYDGDKQKFESYSPFLKQVFSNSQVWVYTL